VSGALPNSSAGSADEQAAARKGNHPERDLLVGPFVLVDRLSVDGAAHWLGRDNDLGYGIMRVGEDQRWVTMYLGQPLPYFLNAFVFEYGTAAYDLELGKRPRDKTTSDQAFRADAARCWTRSGGK
jgi:hypothetical protein